jgi:hypothetical protein
MHPEYDHIPHSMGHHYKYKTPRIVREKTIEIVEGDMQFYSKVGKRFLKKTGSNFTEWKVAMQDPTSYVDELHLLAMAHMINIHIVVIYRGGTWTTQALLDVEAAHVVFGYIGQPSDVGLNMQQLKKVEVTAPLQQQHTDVCITKINTIFTISKNCSAARVPI